MLLPEPIGGAVQGAKLAEWELELESGTKLLQIFIACGEEEFGKWITNTARQLKLGDPIEVDISSELSGLRLEPLLRREAATRIGLGQGKSAERALIAVRGFTSHFTTPPSEESDSYLDTRKAHDYNQDLSLPTAEQILRLYAKQVVILTHVATQIEAATLNRALGSAASSRYKNDLIVNLNCKE